MITRVNTILTEWEADLDDLRSDYSAFPSVRLALPWKSLPTEPSSAGWQSTRRRASAPLSTTPLLPCSTQLPPGPG